MRAPGRRFAQWGTALVVAVAVQSCAHFVLLHDPLSASEHNDLGVAYETSGQPGLAAREYRKSMRLDPHQSRAWVNLGNIEAADGHWRDAEQAYRHALRDSSTDADAMNNLAVALWHQRRHLDEARTLAGQAVASGGERDSVYRATLLEVTQGEP